MKKFVLFNLLLFLMAYIWLSIGIEKVGREHSNEYNFFIKKHLSSKIVFQNWVLCGECDFLPYNLLDNESAIDFQQLCYYRYDLPVKECENLFNPDINKPLKK